MQGTRLATIAFAAVALTAAGCGGSSGSSDKKTASIGSPTSATQTATTTRLAAVTPGTSPQLTSLVLTRRADAICRGIRAKTRLLKVRSPAEFNLAITQVAAYQRTMYVDFGKLAPPASMAADWSQIVANARILAESTLNASQYRDARQVAPGQVQLAAFARARLQLRAAAKHAGLSSSCTRF